MSRTPVNETSTIMNDPIRIHGDDHDRTFIAAIFRAPDGADLPVKIRLSQMDGMPPTVGAYMLDEHGELYRGAVLRWDDGQDSDPRVIYWQAPHCDDDQCGSPCGHVAGHCHGSERLDCAQS